jgi:hypothetical protein
MPYQQPTTDATKIGRRHLQGSTHIPSPVLRGGGWIDGDWISGYEKESFVPYMMLVSNMEAKSAGTTGG